jgi:hypothetical protein
MVGRVKKEAVAHLLYHAMGHLIGRPKTKMPATTKETAWCYGATKIANTIGDRISGSGPDLRIGPIRDAP